MVKTHRFADAPLLMVSCLIRSWHRPKVFHLQGDHLGCFEFKIFLLAFCRDLDCAIFEFTLFRLGVLTENSLGLS